MKTEIAEIEVDKTFEKFKKDAEENGYFLNNDLFFSKELIKGLLINQKRYGYQSCPCRLASGEKAKDLDIICPCDYRDADLTDYGACYCALYVSGEVFSGLKPLKSVPERRNLKKDVAAKGIGNGKSTEEEKEKSGLANLSYPVWRCKVCGYICARENPPEICPVCKAKKERFERFL